MEQGDRQPDSAARAYLTVIAKESPSCTGPSRMKSGAELVGTRQRGSHAGQSPTVGTSTVFSLLGELEMHATIPVQFLGKTAIDGINRRFSLLSLHADEV